MIAAGALLLAGTSLVRHLPQRELTEAPSPPPESPFSERVAAVGLVEASTENIAIGTHIAGIVHQVFVSAGQRVSTERVDTRVLQVIYRFQPDGLPIHVGQQMDVFIEALPISEITRKKLELSVPNPLARSSHN